MSYEPRLIAPFENGLNKYYKPWIIAKEAFPVISNAYTWRGNLRKREGYRLFGTLPGVTPDHPVQGLKIWLNPSSLNETLVAFSLTKSYVWNTTVPEFQDITFLGYGGPGYTNPGQAFSWSNGANDYFWTSNYAGVMWTTNNLTADHIKYWDGTNGAVGVSGGWYTFQPTVSGVDTLDASLMILPYKGRLVALNTMESTGNYPSRARWSQLGTPFTGNVAAQAITNITAGNPTVVSMANTSQFQIGQLAGFTDILGNIGSVLNGNSFNVSAIVANTSITVDIDTTGLTYTSGGLAKGVGTIKAPATFSVDPFAWRDDIPGHGGFVDADTSQRIVTADIIRDTLIVFFQRSTWRLRYTGNEQLPFIWERLNTQYGAESTYSNIAFDDAALAYSRFGWIASSTNDVARIDMDIPDDSFAIESQDGTLTGLSHVQGIRDYYRNFAYWTYQTPPNTADNEIYAYNYIDKKWAVFNPTDSIKCFGSYKTTLDYTWANLNTPQDTWENYSTPDDTWSSFTAGSNNNFPLILGGDGATSGDTVGNVYQMFEFFTTPSTDNAVNFGFNITTKRFNPYIQEGMRCRMAYVDLYMTALVGGEITFQHFIDDQNIPIATRNVQLSARGPYLISAITPGASTTTITTSVPHGLTTGQTISIYDIIGTIGSVLNNQNLVVTVTTTTAFTVAVDTSGLVYISGGFVQYYSTQRGTATYTRIFLGVSANFHQFVLNMSDSQISDPVKGAAQFELQGLVIWTRKDGRIKSSGGICPTG